MEILKKIERIDKEFIPLNVDQSMILRRYTVFHRLNGVSIKPDTLIWDRGNVSKRYVEMVENMGWKLICGIPKTSKETKVIISVTDVPIGPDTLARSSRAGQSSG